MYEKALSIKLKKLGDDYPNVAATYCNMGVVYEKQGKNDEALAMYEGSVDLYEEIGDDHPHVATTYNNMGLVYKNQGKYNEALAMYEKSLSIN